MASRRLESVGWKAQGERSPSTRCLSGCHCECPLRTQKKVPTASDRDFQTMVSAGKAGSCPERAAALNFQLLRVSQNLCLRFPLSEHIQC